MAIGYQDRVIVGPVALGGGVRTDVDAAVIGDRESPSSVNWRHGRAMLDQRPGLGLYAAWSGVTAADRANVWSGILPVKFEFGTAYLVTANATAVYRYDGTTKAKMTSPTLAGTDTDPWAMCYGVDGSTCSPQGAVFLANGADELLYLGAASGAVTSVVTSLTSQASYNGGPASLKPRYCTVYRGRLVLGHVTEPDGAHADRTRASKVNSFLCFNTTNGAQVVDHADTPGIITGVAADENYLYVLKDDAIIIGSDVNGTLEFPGTLKVGCVAGRSFQAVRPGVSLFLGQDNVYRLSGAAYEPVGDAIRRDLFAQINWNRARQVVGHAQHAEGLYRLWIPVGGDTHATRCYVYDWNENVWYVEDYPTQIHSAATVLFGTVTTIASLTGTIGSYTGTIGDWGQEAVAPMLVVGTRHGAGDYRLHRQAEQNYDAGATASLVTPSCETKDFRLGQGYATLYRVTLFYSSSAATTVTLEVSTDRGSSWPTSLTKAAAAGTWRSLTFAVRETGIWHRLRISSSAPGAAVVNPVQIMQAELEYAPRGPLR